MTTNQYQVGGLTNTVGGVVGAAGRGLGETVSGATGGVGKDVGKGIAGVGNGWFNVKENNDARKTDKLLRC
jgi:hypothetical protein